MRRYEWKNVETEEIVDHDHWSKPPELPGEWKRVFSFGLGRVEGGGASPARTSAIKKETSGDKEG